MAEATPEDIQAAVERLGAEFNLSPAAHRLLTLYFEVLLIELAPVGGGYDATPAMVERLMRRIAGSMDLRAGVLPGTEAAMSNQVSASDLLHVWRIYRARGPVHRGGGAPDNPAEAQLAFILDRA